MGDMFEWKAEIKFQGTAADFAQLAEAIVELPIEIYIPEWVCRPHHWAGCMPIPIDVLLGLEHLEKITDGMPRVQIKYIRDIYGGIRTPHLHLKDEVVLLDRARFKTLVAQVAYELAARRVERIDDYVGVMSNVGPLADDPIPIAPVQPGTR
jgi:hypothetical protein